MGGLRIAPAFLFVTLGFAVVISAVTILILIQVDPSVWLAQRPATCMETHCFCEAISDRSSLRQPINSLSSLFFVFAGSLITGYYLVVRKVARIGIWGVLIGLSTILVGVGSAYYHAALTFNGQFWDVYGMHILAGLVVALACRRASGPVLPAKVALGFALYSVLVTVVLWALPDLRRYLFAAVLIFGVVLEVWISRKRARINKPKRLAVAVTTLVIAFAIWWLDNSSLLCEPVAWFQGHALWHLLCAVATLLLCWYYESEQQSSVEYSEPVE